MDGWQNVDSGEDQAMLRWIMGDVEDPSLSLNRLLHATVSDGAPVAFDFNGGFTNLDSGNQSPAMFKPHLHNHQDQIFSPLTDTLLPQYDIKPNLFNTQMVIPPEPKTYNPESMEYKPSMQQWIIDQLFKAADLIQSANNPITAHEILARLNHQLSQAGKPFERVSLYFKEALQLLTHSVLNNNNININTQNTLTDSPFSLIFKISAYKLFSEVSPYVQFVNFTCNQAILESVTGFDRVHVIDFDIGFGGQWASLMQELALSGNGVCSLKITAFVSGSTHDQLELGLTRENLIHFANELNLGFEFEVVNIDVLASASWCLPFDVADNEASVVNLPVHVFSNHQTQIPNVLRFVKSLSPKIVVSVDRGCDRTDLSFSNHLIHALQSYSSLLESLDAVNVNLDSLQKIERFLVQPVIEKIVLGRFLSPEKTLHWHDLFISAGFSPLLFSNFTESQAECLIKRTPVREFHVEKRQSLLVLCWRHRELVSISAWKC